MLFHELINFSLFRRQQADTQLWVLPDPPSLKGERGLDKSLRKTPSLLWAHQSIMEEEQPCQICILAKVDRLRVIACFGLEKTQYFLKTFALIKRPGSRVRAFDERGAGNFNHRREPL